MRFTKPSSRASSASMKRLSNASSFALRGWMSQGSEKYSTSPARNRASGEANTRSIAAAIIQPPKMQYPRTTAMVGLGRFRHFRV
jgi:hypothetical protein